MTNTAVQHEPVSYQVLPALSEKKYAELRQSIIEKGVEVAVIVDENGNIIDGHHRDQIATELGIGYKTDRRVGLAEHEKRLLAFEVNTVRRDGLTDAQMTLAGRLLEPDYAERARLRQGARNDLTSGTSDPEVERTRDSVAAEVGLGSGRTYERNKKVIERVEAMAPQLMPALESGAITLREAAKDIRDIARSSSVARDLESEATLDSVDPVGAQGVRDAYLLSQWTAAVSRQAKVMTDLMSFDLAEVVHLCDEETRHELRNTAEKWREMSDRALNALKTTAAFKVVNGGTAR